MDLRKRRLLTGLGACLLGILNALLGAHNFSDAGEITKCGLYAGEYVILVIWLAWGTGTILGRLTLVSAFGLAWALSTWIGFGIAKVERAFAYSQEFYYVFNVLPLAFAISSFPVMLFRKTCSFQLGTTKSSSRVGLILLVPLSICIVVTYSQCMYLHWNLFYSVVIGILLACVSGITAPFLAYAILDRHIRIRIILAVLVVGCVPGIYVANIFSMPGPGAAGVVSLWFESIGGSIAAITLVIGTFFYWRFIGVRFVLTKNRQRAEESGYEMNIEENDVGSQ